VVDGTLEGRRRAVVPLVCVLLFISGGCALAYQLLWHRLLSLVFGVSVYAAATTLACFFVGLAIGSFAGGRAADRTGRPLFWYGLVEIAIGLTALVTPLAFDLLEDLYVGVHGSLPDSLAVLTVLRFLMAAAVLIVPATLMGTTLPLVVRGVVAHAGDLGPRMGLIYATNTAGAFVGTLAVGSWFIGSIGIRGTFLIGAALNVAVGIAALMISRAWESDRRVWTAEAADGVTPAQAPEPATARETRVDFDTDLVVSRQVRYTVLAVFAISGFAILALEVVWFRVLTFYVDATSYAFAIMLAAVLVGIAAGSYLIAPVMRRRHDWVWVLALVEITLAALALLSLFFMAQTYNFYDGDVARSWPFMVAVSLFGIFPAALVSGAAFPIGLRIWASGIDEDATGAGERLGTFYSVNVAAGIVGSVAAGFLLIPLLGTKTTLIFLASILLVSGLLLLAALPGTRRLVVGVVVVVAFVALIVVAVPNPYTAALENRYPGEELLWQDEGAQATVSVHERPDVGPVMYIDGLSQATTSADVVELHRMIGVLPTAVHPDPKTALVVGLGGGATPGAIAAQHGMDVTVVELSRGVIHASDWFRDVNYRVVDRDNTHMRVDDGRNHLLVTDDRYDVITADIIPPGTAGAGKLWSVEYWRLAREALRPGGVMLQWIGDLRPEPYKMIMRSFLEVFPETTLWYHGQLLVGTKGPLQLDRASFERRLEFPETRAVLADVGITSFDDLMALYYAGPSTLHAYVGAGPLLTDDRPRLEFYNPFTDKSEVVDTNTIRDDDSRILTG